LGASDSARSGPARSSYVMKTGHAGLITGKPGTFQLKFWNVNPERLDGTTLQ
jgi:hypothetical protein